MENAAPLESPSDSVLPLDPSEPSLGDTTSESEFESEPKPASPVETEETDAEGTAPLPDAVPEQAPANTPEDIALEDSSPRLYEDQQRQDVIDTGKWALILLQPSTITKATRVFVPSADYERCRNNKMFDTDEQRVFIVYGPPNSGRFTTAIHLAQEFHDFLPESRFYLYNRTIRDDRSLLEFVQYGDLPRDAVFIVENAFDVGIGVDQISRQYLDPMTNQLRDKGGYLFLTVSSAYQNQLDILEIPKVNVQIDDLEPVFTKHSELYQDLNAGYDIRGVSAELLKQAEPHRPDIVCNFQHPFQVNLFFQGLSGISLDEMRDGLDGKENKFIQLARQIGRIGQEPAIWFRNLPANAKLYALLGFLFSGTDGDILNEIYTLAVNELRQDGLGEGFLKDAREFGLTDILQLIHAHRDADVVQFETRVLADEVQRQIGNYHHLLWSLIDKPTEAGLLLKLVELYKSPDFWELRRDIGVAIGRVGIYHMTKLSHVLELLTQHPSGGVVAVAGYALDELCRRDPSSEHHQFVLDMLDRWTKSRNPDLMWAAGIAVWRVYDSLTKENKSGDKRASSETESLVKSVANIITDLGREFGSFGWAARKTALFYAWEKVHQENLTEPKENPTEPKSLADAVLRELALEPQVASEMRNQLARWAARNVGAVLHAMRQIARTHPSDVVTIVKEWLQSEPDTNLYELALMVGNQLFRENSDPQFRLVEEKHRPLLELVGPLAQTNQPVVDTVLDSLLVWLQQDGWADLVHRTLLYVVNRATLKQKMHLRVGLSDRWLTSDVEIAREMGSALIARSYLMEGAPVEVPGSNRAVLALDASHRGHSHTCAQLGLQAHARLASHLDVQVFRMGDPHLLDVPSSVVSLSDLKAPYNYAYARLLMPSLENLDLQTTSSIIVLTWQQIVDLDDALDSAWGDRLLIVTTVEQKCVNPDRLHSISIREAAPEEALTLIEGFIYPRLAHTIIKRQASDWEQLLSQLVDTLPLQSNDVESLLDERASQLDAPMTAKYSVDVARLAMCTSLWLASHNLERYVSWVQTQLQPSDQEDTDAVWEASDQNSGGSKLLAAAAGRAMFNAFVYASVTPQVETHSALLRLAIPLAHHSWDAARSVLSAMRIWARNSAWWNHLFVAPRGSSNEVLALIQTILPTYEQELMDLLAGWDQNYERDDLAVQEADRKFLEQIRLYVAFSTRISPPDLPEGDAYGLILIDASHSAASYMSRITKIASSLAKQVQQAEGRLHLLIYHLGQDFPIFLPGDIPSAQDLVPSVDTRRPPLMGPVLEAYDVNQVQFVIMLMRDPAWDEADWYTSPWRSRIVAYTDAERSRYSTQFDLLPRQSDIDAATSVIENQISRMKGA